MSLIKCPDCSKEVSGNAPACPHCGSPIKATTIEQTSKKWKKMTLTAWAMVIGGFLFIFNSQGNAELAMIASFTILGGIILGIYAKVNTWWHHK